MAGRQPPPGGEVSAASGLHWSLNGVGWASFTDRQAGDLRGGGPEIDARRRLVVDLPWSVPRQIHGARVLVVEAPRQGSGEEADALVTSAPGVALAVLTADCAPVAFSSAEGIVGVAHAGWRGLQAGVLESTVEAMRGLGATDVKAVLGPCIHACCYEFGLSDLADLSARLGPEVESLDRLGRPALDVPAAVGSALSHLGVPVTGEVAACTGCSDRYWSWRARGDSERQATVVWR